MTLPIPERLQDLLTRQKRAFAFLALVKKDGTPQVTPIWFDFDGQHFIFNTARGRVKDKIMRRGPRVAFVILDPSITAPASTPSAPARCASPTGWNRTAFTRGIDPTTVGADPCGFCVPSWDVSARN